jgi:hypothetical protein
MLKSYLSEKLVSWIDDVINILKFDTIAKEGVFSKRLSEREGCSQRQLVFDTIAVEKGCLPNGSFASGI